MKKQFQITLNDAEKYIIDLNDNEAVSIRALNNPYVETKRKEPPTVMHIDGNRWHDDKMDILEWDETVLSLGDKITIKFVTSDKAPS